MQTIIQLFEESVSRYPGNPYLFEKSEGNYHPMTYSEVHARVLNFASGLVNAGIRKGDRIALISEGRNDWVISELAILYAGAVNVPLSIKLNEPSEIEFRLQHSEARFVITSASQLKKLRVLKGHCTQLEKIIVLDALEKYEALETFAGDLSGDGEGFLKSNAEQLEKICKSVLPDDLANICYTSGTTAEPKGIMLTHRNYTANAEQCLSLMDVPEYFTTLLILPWDHAFAHSVGIYAIMKAGASIASIQSGATPMETIKNIPVNIKEIKPFFLLSVPSLAKNFKKNIENGIAAKGKFIEKLFNAGLRIAYSYNGMSSFEKGRGFRFFLKPFYAFFNVLIFKKIRANFGGRLRYFIGGGALLDTELQRFFYAVGIPMFQGYGLTEAAPVISSNSERKHKFGSSGYLVSDLELKICDDIGNRLPAGEKGEIVVKGKNVMAGYWRNPVASAETLQDGWLHSGDLGYMDKDGFLFVMGRFKSLLIADDGEKYSPESIEETMVGQSHVIEQCMMYNNQNPYTICLLVPGAANLKRWLREKHFDPSSEEAQRAALAHIENEIKLYRTGNHYGKLFPQRWLPSTIGIIAEPFSEENHLMNSTMKIVRGKIIEKYHSRIDYLYTSDAKDICNERNMEAMIQLLK